MKAKIIVAITMLLFAGLANAQDAGVAWEALSEEQQRVLSNFSENWGDLEPARQTRLSMGAERWSRMTPKQRGVIWRRIAEIRFAIVTLSTARWHRLTRSVCATTFAVTRECHWSAARSCVTVSRICRLNNAIDFVSV